MPIIVMNVILMQDIIDMLLPHTNSAMLVQRGSMDMNQLDRAFGVTQLAKNVGVVHNMDVKPAIILYII